MKLIVTGATGFLGSAITRHLLADGHDVLAVSREPSSALAAGAAWSHGDVTTGSGLAEALAGADGVVHLVGIIREAGASFQEVHVTGTRNVLAAALAAGAGRFVHVSAVGADPHARSEYQRTKGVAEGLVEASNASWTVLRPSLVFGAGDDFFGRVLKGLVTGPPVVPVVGRGEYRFRPIWVGDVASAVASSLRRPSTSGRSYDLVGPEEYSLRELLLLVRSALRSRKPLVSVPVALIRAALPLLALLPNPPITRDEFLMLLAGNAGDPRPATEALGLELARLEGQLESVLA